MFLHIDYAVRVNVVMCKEVKPISCFSKDIKILIFPYSETAMEFHQGRMIFLVKRRMV